MNLKENLSEEDKTYLEDIRDNNPSIHQYNYEFIDTFIDKVKNSQFYIYEKINEEEDYLIYNGNSVIGRMNFSLNFELFNTGNHTFISYKVGAYLLKIIMKFDIDRLMDERSFINIIQYAIICINYHAEWDRNNKDFVVDNLKIDGEDEEDEITRKKRFMYNDQLLIINKMYAIRYLFFDCIDILYNYDKTEPHYIYKGRKDKLKEDFENTYNLLTKTIINKHARNKTNVTENEITDEELLELSEGLLDKYIGNEEIENIDSKKEVTISREEAIENSKPKTEDKYDYEDITEKLLPYINGGTPATYKSIIEKKKLLDPNQHLEMKSGIKADIIRFADCFEIPISKVNKMFQLTVKRNNEDKVSVNDLLRALRLFNKDLYK